MCSLCGVRGLALELTRGAARDIGCQIRSQISEMKLMSKSFEMGQNLYEGCIIYIELHSGEDVKFSQG